MSLYPITSGHLPRGCSLATMVAPVQSNAGVLFPFWGRTGGLVGEFYHGMLTEGGGIGMFGKRDLQRVSRLVMLILSLVLMLGGAAWADNLVIHFIDVGQGDSVLVQTPSRATVLVDAGDTKAGREVVVPYLEELGIEYLDLVVMTHPHFDHIGGLIPVLKRYPVEQVLADGQIHTTRTYEDLLRLIFEKEIPFRLARAGEELTIPGLDEVLILNPQEPLLQGLNNNSVALWLRHGDIAVLLTGDIEAAAEERILARGQFPKAQILKVAHHGSGTSTTPAFLQAVSPENAIISLGADNTYNHPHGETLRHLEGAEINIWRTDLRGTIIVVSDGVSYRVLGEGETPSLAHDTAVEVEVSH